jgi:predicted transcriptional regulator
MSAAYPLPLPKDALDVAPLDMSDFTAEQQAEIEASLADLAAGRARVVPHEDVQRALHEMRSSASE